MGAKTKTVGGGAAKPVAADFTNFLSEGLMTGNFGGYMQQPQQGASNAQQGIMRMFGQGQPNQVGQAAGGQAVSSTTGVAGLMNNMLAGNVGDPMNIGAFINSQLGQPGNTAGVPAFQGVNFQQGQQAVHNTPQVDLSFNPMQRMATDVNSPFASAVQQVMEREKMKDVANLRARYGASGGSGLGSGAQFAEGNYLAEANPRTASALGEINMQEQQIDLANRANAEQNILQSLGLMLSQRGQDIGANLQATGMNNDMTNMLNQLMLSQAGMQNQHGLQGAALNNDYQMGLAGLGLNMNQMGLNAQQNMLGQIFNSMNQINALGTPQAQVVQQPGAFSQIMGGVTGALGALNPIAGAMGGWGNIFGGGNQSMPALIGQNGAPPVNLPNPYGGVGGIRPYSQPYVSPWRPQ